MKSRTKTYESLLWSAGATESEMLHTWSVYPSGVAFAAIAVAIVLPAPGRLSTTTCWPHTSLSFEATTRVEASVGPPAAGPSTRRTGLSG